jgi:iron complex transport system substrate-binding protein
MNVFRIVILFSLMMTAVSMETAAAVITYTDKLNRTVDIPVPVKRAVFLQMYEMLPALDVWDRVVGIASYAFRNELLRKANPRLDGIPSVGSGANVNVEAILQLKPDLVITWAWHPEAIRFMEGKGLRVIAVYPESIDDLYREMALLGTLFQREERMAAVRGEMQSIFALVRERVAHGDGSKKQKMVYLGGQSNMVSCAIGINNDLLTLIGGNNPADAIGQRSTLVAIEQIVAWDPDLIFIWGNAGYSAEDILTNPQWRHIKAVRDKRVYKLPGWTTWSPRLALVALWMAKKAHPRDFQDIELADVADALCRKAFRISCTAETVP